MPGVMFSKSAAKRIADAVRKVERIPGGEQDLQRQRAGGLGRLTLWQVTAVQTGPETVTIKRVHNIDFDLNDPSEKEDILYDPDNEPAVGDRGLLIRLGEGPLFFFKEGGAEPTMIKAQASMIADDTEYSVKVLEADGTEGAAFNVRRPVGVFVKTGSVGFLGQDSSSQSIFIHAHSMPLAPLATDSVGVLTEGLEAADTDTWDATTSANGLAFDLMPRVAYFDAGDEKLYGYTRRLIFDELGHLVTVSAENRIVIDVPVICT